MLLLRSDPPPTRRLAALAASLLLPGLFLAGCAPSLFAEEAAGLGPAEGIASWYGYELAGRPTASGEPFDPEARTAAHRTLPFGTRVRVVRLDTGDAVVVRINDRGPVARERVIDLALGAARAIAMVDDGLVRVRLEVLP